MRNVRSRLDGSAYAACASLPLNVRPCLSPEIVTFSPSLILPGEDHLGERILHRFLDHALQRARAVGRVLALVGQPIARARIELDGDLAILEQLLQPRHLDVDDAAHLASS